MEKEHNILALSNYFKNLEEEAKRLGIDLDDLMDEYNHNGYAKLAAEEDDSKAAERKEVFEKEQNKKSKKTKVIDLRSS